MLRPLLALGLTFSAAILACGGAVVPVGESSSSSTGGTSSGGTSTSSGGTSTSSGGTSTSSGGTSGVTPPGCTELPKPGDRVCVPGLALAGVPISVDVDSQDSCLDCTATVAACDVSVNGNAITVTMQELSCNTSSPGCSCVLMEEQCVIPPLAAGTYDLTIGGGATSTGFHSQTLVVADGGPDTACILLPQGTMPPPIDPTKYSTACSADSDCVAVSTGDVCGPCDCANTVIATSDKARYDADFRATESQCAPSLPAGCPLCRGAAPHCLVSPDALVGTCVAGP